MDYKLIYSDRKTLGLSVRDGLLTVRVPKGTSHKTIEAFIKKHIAWIERNIEKTKHKKDVTEGMSEAEIRKIKEEAKRYLSGKTEYYSKIMNIKYSRITITAAKTRYGSCSSKGNISYSYRLMLYPEPAREYVIVHELAHILEMNHSKRFYSIIEKIMPDYKERKKMLG